MRQRLEVPRQIAEITNMAIPQATHRQTIQPAICQFDEDSPKASMSPEKKNTIINNNKLLQPTIDPLFNATINNLFQIKEKLGNGSFGVIYRAVSTHPSKAGFSYACKVEKITSKVYQQLPTEYRILQSLHENISHPAIGFSHCHYFSSNAVASHNILVMDLLGSNLEQCLRSAKSRRLSLKTVLMLADQIITRIEHLHSKEFLHRDIKPENILIGMGDKDTRVYLVDFGLSKKYLRHDGKHIEFKDGKNLTGTARYSSLNTHLGFEQSRRDDMESIAYVLIYLAKGKLPWMKIVAADKREKYQKIQILKETISEAILCDGLPQEFGWFLKYTKQLEFAEKPNYEKCREWFRSLIVRYNFEHDCIWDWKEGNVEKGKQLLQLQQQSQELAKMQADAQWKQVKEVDKGKQLVIEAKKEGEAVRLGKQITEVRQMKMIPQEHQFQQKQGVECIAVDCNNSLRIQPPMQRDTNSPYNRIPGQSRHGQKPHKTKPKDGQLQDKNRESNVLRNKITESKLTNGQISTGCLGISQQPIGYFTQTGNQLDLGKLSTPINEKEQQRNFREMPQEYFGLKSQNQFDYSSSQQQQLKQSEQLQKQNIVKENIHSLTNSNFNTTNIYNNPSALNNIISPSDLSTSMYTSQIASISQQYQQKSMGEIQNLGTQKLESYIGQIAFPHKIQNTPYSMLGQGQQPYQQQQILQEKQQPQQSMHLTRTEGNERATNVQQKEYFFQMQYPQSQPRPLVEHEQKIAYSKQPQQEKQLVQTQQQIPMQKQKDQQQTQFYSTGVLPSSQQQNQQLAHPLQSQQIYLPNDLIGQSSQSMYQNHSNIHNASTSSIRNNSYFINTQQYNNTQEKLKQIL